MTDADTNTTIAEAMGWTNLHTRVTSSGVVLFGNPQHYDGEGLPAPTYMVDANAMHKALAKLCPGYTITHILDSEKERWAGEYEACGEDTPGRYGPTVCDVGCKLILAGLAERKESS